MLVGDEWFLQVEVGVSAVLDLPESLKVPQEDVTEPLGVDAGDPPLLGLLIFQTTGVFTDEHSVTTTEVACVSGSCQVGHQLQVVTF